MVDFVWCCVRNAFQDKKIAFFDLNEHHPKIDIDHLVGVGKQK